MPLSTSFHYCITPQAGLALETRSSLSSWTGYSSYWYRVSDRLAKNDEGLILVVVLVLFVAVVFMFLDDNGQDIVDRVQLIHDHHIDDGDLPIFLVAF